MRTAECRLAVAFEIAILDVVVDERRLVKAFHRHGDPLDCVVRPLVMIGVLSVVLVIATRPQRLEHRRSQKGPPPPAADSQPLATNRLGMAHRRSHQSIERRPFEPRLHGVVQAAEIEPSRPVGRLEVDVVPDPVDIDRRIDAVVLEQWHGHRRNRRRLHVRKCFFKHSHAAHADDRLDRAGLHHRHHQRRALGHEHRVAESLGLRLEILDRAEAALLAEQAELVERRRAAVFHPQALGHEQEPALEGHGSEGVAPRLVVDGDDRVIEIRLRQARLGERGGRPPAEFVHAQWRHGPVTAHPAPHGVAEGVAIRLRRGNAGLWWPRPDHRRRHRWRQDRKRNRRWVYGGHRGHLSGGSHSMPFVAVFVRWSGPLPRP